MNYRGWHIADVQYLHHKAVTSIALEREDGKRLYVNVSDEAFEKHPTAYFPSDSQAKENPQGIDSDDESIVGAGTDFLMKVTEEAVISGMILAGESPARVRDSNRRSHYRDAAEMITLEEVKRFVEFDQQDDSPFTFRPQSDAPEPAKVDSVPVPKPADRFAPHGTLVYGSSGKLNPIGSDEEFRKYLDETKGPSS